MMQTVSLETPFDVSRDTLVGNTYKLLIITINRLLTAM